MTKYQYRVISAGPEGYTEKTFAQGWAADNHAVRAIEDSWLTVMERRELPSDRWEHMGRWINRDMVERSEREA